MSFREKNAWIAVVSTLAIWIYYFWRVLGDALAGTLDGDALFWLFVWCMGITLVMMLGANIVVAIVSRQHMDAPADERERAIDSNANRVGLILLQVTLTAVLLASGWLTDFARVSFPDDPAGAIAIILVHAVLFFLMLSALVREIVQIVHFRMMG